ncbi:hypothetical protein [Trinickia soli]|uniref:Uncharacterized protein n=1 Tax=Trinickia soli TaxID=380675 RepID=A0A2N7VQ40_9BURK|nr:hypothetical protein [Trinickia soli]PMS19279.1 hypothetical protein C0Z19_21855 [Trinickia soli]CAB3644284.1 hypothetical protein LMG24076_00477 [Trinickia soli]
MQVKIKGFIYAEPCRRWSNDEDKLVDALRFDFATYQKSKEYSPQAVLVREHEIEVDVPDDFDIRDGLVANLEAEKQAVMAAYQKRVTEIKAQIQQLLAIEA